MFIFFYSSVVSQIIRLKKVFTPNVVYSDLHVENFTFLTRDQRVDKKLKNNLLSQIFFLMKNIESTNPNIYIEYCII